MFACFMLRRNFSFKFCVTVVYTSRHYTYLDVTWKLYCTFMSVSQITWRSFSTEENFATTGKKTEIIDKYEGRETKGYDSKNTIKKKKIVPPSLSWWFFPLAKDLCGWKYLRNELATGYFNCQKLDPIAAWCNGQTCQTDYMVRLRIISRTKCSL